MAETDFGFYVHQCECKKKAISVSLSDSLGDVMHIAGTDSCCGLSMKEVICRILHSDDLRKLAALCNAEADRAEREQDRDDRLIAAALSGASHEEFTPLQIAINALLITKSLPHAERRLEQEEQKSIQREVERIRARARENEEKRSVSE